LLFHGFCCWPKAHRPRLFPRAPRTTESSPPPCQTSAVPPTNRRRAERTIAPPSPPTLHPRWPRQYPRPPLCLHRSRCSPAEFHDDFQRLRCFPPNHWPYQQRHGYEFAVQPATAHAPLRTVPERAPLSATGFSGAKNRAHRQGPTSSGRDHQKHTRAPRSSIYGSVAAAATIQLLTTRGPQSQAES